MVKLILKLFANLTSFNILTLGIAKNSGMAQTHGYPYGYPTVTLSTYQSPATEMN
jgi:hypothetical protein